MPQSPYLQQIDPPVTDVQFEAARHNLDRIRWEREAGVDDEFALDTSLRSGELIIKHCEFLDSKLDSKRRDIHLLHTQNEDLAKKVDTLEMEAAVVKDENTRYLREMERLGFQVNAYNKEVITVKARLGMEIEQLRIQNEALRKELSTSNARSQKNRMETPMQHQQSRVSDDQAGDTYKAIEPTEAAARGRFGKQRFQATDPAMVARPPFPVPLNRIETQMQQKPRDSGDQAGDTYKAIEHAEAAAWGRFGRQRFDATDPAMVTRPSFPVPLNRIETQMQQKPRDSGDQAGDTYKAIEPVVAAGRRFGRQRFQATDPAMVARPPFPVPLNRIETQMQQIPRESGGQAGDTYKAIEHAEAAAWGRFGRQRFDATDPAMVTRPLFPVPLNRIETQMQQKPRDSGDQAGDTYKVIEPAVAAGRRFGRQRFEATDPTMVTRPPFQVQLPAPFTASLLPLKRVSESMSIWHQPLKRTRCMPASKAPEPEASEPEVPEPDAPESEAPEPEASEPEVPEPDSPEPEAPEPEEFYEEEGEYNSGDYEDDFPEYTNHM